MRTRLFFCLLLAISCVKRINPDPGDSRTTVSGVPLRFGQPQQLPAEVRQKLDQLRQNEKRAGRKR